MIYPTDYADVTAKLNAQLHSLERRERVPQWVVDLLCVGVAVVIAVVILKVRGVV